MSTEEIHNCNIDCEDIEIVTLLTLVHLVQIGTATKKSCKSEAQKGSNGRIRKDHQEQRCVVRDQG